MIHHSTGMEYNIKLTEIAEYMRKKTHDTNDNENWIEKEVRLKENNVL